MLQRRERKLKADKFLAEGVDGQYRLTKKGREEIALLFPEKAPEDDG
jgi:hypothetical protein